MEKRDEAVAMAKDHLADLRIPPNSVHERPAPFESVELAFDLPFPEWREFQSTIRISKSGGAKEFMFRFPAVDADEYSQEEIRSRCRRVKRRAGVPEAITIEVNTDGFDTTWQPHFGIENSHTLTLEMVLDSLAALIEVFATEFDEDEFTQERIQ